jgi:hypothetical protein
MINYMNKMIRRNNERGISPTEINIPPKKHKKDWRLMFGNINTLGDYTNEDNAMKWDQFQHIIT